MKRLLLFALAFGVGTLAYGQQAVKQGYKVNTKAPHEYTEVNVPDLLQPGPVNKHQSSKGAISFNVIGYSNNVYNSLVEQTTGLSANQDLSLISCTHRGKVGEHGAASSGDIMNSYSTDGGMTFNTYLYLQNSSSYNNRYPSGVIYNPANNTNVSNAYVVYCGPSHQGGTWDHNFFGSGKFDSTNINNQYIPSNGALVRMGMTATSDGKIHVAGPLYTSTPYTTDTVYLYTGEFNSSTNSFDWTIFKLDTFEFVTDPATGNYLAYNWFWNTAWSKGGSIGYLWTLGRVNNYDHRSYQPVVWKTTDGGATWTMMPPFDFGTLTTITNRLQPMRGMSISRPQFTSSLDGVVDVNGDLHLFALVKAAFSDHNDSLGYSYIVAGLDNNGAAYNPIFDVYTTANGWDARFISNIYTFEVDADESGYGSGSDAIGWDMRLQAGRTDDGVKVFASWTDSDTSSAPAGTNGFPLNMFPNIYVQGYDVVSGKGTNPTNFTVGSSQDGDCYFHYMSETILSGGGAYNIPLTEIDKGNTPLDFITHHYVYGVKFSDADFITNPGFETASKTNIATVSQNRPNPFSDFTTIDVRLTESANVVIEVMNITGQKVMVLNQGKLGAGQHSFRINAGDLPAGVYFYTVQANDTRVTKKMIVE